MDPLELERTFSIAVRREIEAYEFYGDVAGRMKDPSVRDIFARLAKEEMGHIELLEGFKCDPSLIMKFEAPRQDFKVAEATELPSLSIEMKPADALALAMKKEQQAVELYRSLAAASTDTGLKSIFENLAGMELGHKQRLESLFIDIGYPESF